MTGGIEMGRVVFITGTNRGIGNAILKEFCKEKDIIVLAHARKPSSSFERCLDSLHSEYGCTIVPVFFDLGDEKAIYDNVKIVLQDYSKIDVLVNNAGIMHSNSSFLMTPLDTIKQTFQVNFYAPVLITQLVTKAMIRNKAGSIVNLTSVAALDGTAGQFDYTCSKSSIIGMTLKLAMELAPYGIRCNAIAPGIIQTEMMDYLESPLRDTLAKRVYLKRFGTAEEIAKVVVFLSGNDASYINGQVIRVDGGSGAYN
jgi:3-oxoacyl-[acyl-carrier protein] reductase